MGSNTALWIGDALSASQGDYGQRMAAVFEAVAKNLRGDSVLQKLLAWELAWGHRTRVRSIDAARSKAMYGVMPKLRGRREAAGRRRCAGR